MEIKLNWRIILIIWFKFAILSTLIGFALIFIAPLVAFPVGLLGYFAGFSDVAMMRAGAILGLVLYLIGSIFALRFAIGNDYKKFKITFFEK
jgi:hypothetical protein